MRRRLIPPQQPFLGMGTAGSPYRIATAEQLADLATKVNSDATDTLRGGLYQDKHYLQVAHLDLSAYANFNPIGAVYSVFSGVYDGNGFIISNLNISVNTVSSSRTGLFGACNNASIKNICIASGTISATGGNCFIGGVVGYADGNTDILNCCNAADIINNGTNYSTFTGGIGGYIWSSGSVTNCSNHGRVQNLSTTTGAMITGGIIGYKRDVTVTLCLNTGGVSYISGSGGVICGGGSPVSSYFDKDVSLLGAQTGAKGLTTAQCKGAAAEVNMPNLDWVNTWRTNEDGYPTLRVFDK